MKYLTQRSIRATALKQIQEGETIIKENESIILLPQFDTMDCFIVKNGRGAVKIKLKDIYSLFIWDNNYDTR